MKAIDLLDTFIEMHGGKIPTTAVNWSSENSDISFIWTYHYLAITDLWRATKDPRALKMLIEATEWVFTQTDQALGINHTAEVVVSWGPKKVEQRSIASHGYGASPSADINPGWSRYITYEGSKKGFRPEILASGHIGYAIASFIRDAFDLWVSESTPESVMRANRWLKILARIFLYHDPNWRDSHAHSGGSIYTQPVAGYWWPRAVGDEIWDMQPGLNQQSQFLSMGVVVEELLGEDIGAKDKMKMYCERTLPNLLVKDGNRIGLRYDFRDHSKMSPKLAEPLSDSTHTQKAMPLLIEGERLGFIDPDLHGGIINQTRDVTYKSDGDFAVLMDGTDEHGREKDHPGVCFVIDAVQLPGGHALMPLYEKALAFDFGDFPGSGGHKAWHAYARFARVKELSTGVSSNEASPVQPVSEPAKKKSAGGSSETGDSGAAGDGDSVLSIGGIGAAVNIPGTDKLCRLVDDCGGCFNTASTDPVLVIRALQYGHGGPAHVYTITWEDSTGAKHKQQIRIE